MCLLHPIAFYLFLDFHLLITHIAYQKFFFEKIKVSDKSDNAYCHNGSEIFEDGFIVIDKKYSEHIDTRCPDDRADHIIEPEIPLEHPRTSSDKWNK